MPFKWIPLFTSDDKNPINPQFHTTLTFFARKKIYFSQIEFHDERNFYDVHTEPFNVHRGTNKTKNANISVTKRQRLQAKEKKIA